VNEARPIATLILAAGSSSRLGRPKQLLPYRGSNLLRHAAETALDAGVGPVFVVLGCLEADCRQALAGLPLEIVVNTAWEEGLGTSIAIGMRRIDETSFRAVLITLCDQPHITAVELRALAGALESNEIVASDAGDAVGPPAIFAAGCFDQLRALRGRQGARGLFKSSDNLITIPCARAAVDVDTEEDVARLGLI
jgi:CTP:molybdopterin cytidylyltransferase MocA